MKTICPHLKVGITLSLHDFQPDDDEGSQKIAQREWEKEFIRYLPYITNDDFFGLQNYTRKDVYKRQSAGSTDGFQFYS